MKKISLLFSIVFSSMTFICVGSVFISNVSAGYAVIPMIFALVCINSYRNSQ